MRLQQTTFYDHFSIFLALLTRIKFKSLLSCYYGEFALNCFCNTDLNSFLSFLKKSLVFSFRSLLDLFGADFLSGGPRRVEISYVLVSYLFGYRFRVKTCVLSFLTRSVQGVYDSVAWLEREVWDLYGVVFLGHTDLRRILTDYGFKGHPLRKDFPLSGFLEVRFSEVLKHIVYEPVELSQRYRYFRFRNPWL